MNIDEKSLNVIADVFGTQSGYVLSATTDAYCHYDLYGKNYIIECKDRDIPHWKYFDNTIQADKLEWLQEEIMAQKKWKTAYVVSLFNDGYMAINRYDDSYTTTLDSCPKTTAFKDNEYVNKKMVHYLHPKYVKVNVSH